MDKELETSEAAVKGSLLSRLLLIFGILLLVVAVGIAAFVAWQYLDAQNRYREIQSVAGLEISEPELVSDDLQLEDLVFDWEALRAINPHTVGWIIVPGTAINYPIVQGPDNDYYLYHLFDSSSSGTGAIFADYEGSPTLAGPHNVIYGHNMFDGSMFSDIYKYTNQEYFDGHRKLFLCTPERNFELKTIATLNVRADAPIRRFEFEDQYKLTIFMQETLTAAVAQASDMNELTVEAESFYSFVTCETFEASTRIVLCAVPVNSVDITVN